MLRWLNLINKEENIKKRLKIYQVSPHKCKREGGDHHNLQLSCKVQLVEEEPVGVKVQTKIHG